MKLERCCSWEGRAAGGCPARDAPVLSTIIQYCIMLYNLLYYYIIVYCMILSLARSCHDLTNIWEDEKACAAEAYLRICECVCIQVGRGNYTGVLLTAVWSCGVQVYVAKVYLRIYECICIAFKHAYSEFVRYTLQHPPVPSPKPPLYLSKPNKQGQSQK